MDLKSPYDSHTPTPSAPEPEIVQSLFEGIAKSYDRFNRFASLGLDRRWRKDIISPLIKEGLEGKVVLDIGTGTGDLLFEIETRVKKGSFIGLDFSYSMLKEARKKIECSSLIQGEAQGLPIMSNSVDRIVSAFVMRNIKKILESSLLEMHRVLKVGGKLSLLEMYVPHSKIFKVLHRAYLESVLPLWGRAICGVNWSGNYLPQTIYSFGSPEDFSRILRASGFKNIEFKSFMGGVAVFHTASK